MRLPVGTLLVARRVTLMATVVLAGFVPWAGAYALPNCENINDNFSIIGEARYYRERKSHDHLGG